MIDSLKDLSEQAKIKSNDIMNLQQDMIADINHAGFTLVYTGSTNGWKLVEVA